MCVCVCFGQFECLTTSAERHRGCYGSVGHVPARLELRKHFLFVPMQYGDSRFNWLIQFGLSTGSACYCITQTNKESIQFTPKSDCWMVIGLGLGVRDTHERFDDESDVVFTADPSSPSSYTGATPVGP